jgi:hypothetical protein
MVIAENEIVDRFQLKSVIVPVKIRTYACFFGDRHFLLSAPASGCADPERVPVWSINPIHTKSSDDGGKGPSCDAAPPATVPGRNTTLHHRGITS